MAEFKIAEFKMAAIIKLSQNEWVKIFCANGGEALVWVRVFFVQNGGMQDGRIGKCELPVIRGKTKMS